MLLQNLTFYIFCSIQSRKKVSPSIQEMKPSIQRLKVVRVLDKLDKLDKSDETHGEVYVKDQRALRDHLNGMIFEQEWDK